MSNTFHHNRPFPPLPGARIKSAWRRPEIAEINRLRQLAWTRHARERLTERGIDAAEAEDVCRNCDLVCPGQDGALLVRIDRGGLKRRFSGSCPRRQARLYQLVAVVAPDGCIKSLWNVKRRGHGVERFPRREL